MNRKQNKANRAFLQRNAATTAQEKAAKVAYFIFRPSRYQALVAQCRILKLLENAACGRMIRCPARKRIVWAAVFASLILGSLSTLSAQMEPEPANQRVVAANSSKERMNRTPVQQMELPVEETSPVLEKRGLSIGFEEQRRPTWPIIFLIFSSLGLLGGQLFFAWRQRIKTIHEVAAIRESALPVLQATQETQVEKSHKPLSKKAETPSS